MKIALSAASTAGIKLFLLGFLTLFLERALIRYLAGNIWNLVHQQLLAVAKHDVDEVVGAVLAVERARLLGDLDALDVGDRAAQPLRGSEAEGSFHGSARGIEDDPVPRNTMNSIAT